MTDIYNFSAGPAVLPKEVLKEAQNNLLDYKNTGMSVMEMSHRGADFMDIAERAEKSLRKIMNIPENYSVLFLQGGATQQFSLIPMNQLGDKEKVAYIDTGAWSSKAIKAAEKFCEVDVIAESKSNNYSNVPDFTDLDISNEYAYLHITPNETIGGLKYGKLPKSSVPIVADMSSMILSEEIDVNEYGMIYAGAQKNIGPAGLTIIIINNDLLEKASEQTPDILNYTKMAAKGSMMNTPPTFAWYMSGLVFDWIDEQGGIPAVEKSNKEKAALLYGYIDESDFYSNPIDKEYRSLMNVPFILSDDSLNEKFLSSASEAGLLSLKGHRSVGGMRASIYNAMPVQGVKALVDFMKKFESNNS